MAVCVHQAVGVGLACDYYIVLYLVFASTFCASLVTPGLQLNLPLCSISLYYKFFMHNEYAA